MAIFESIRLFLALAVYLNLKIKQLDITTAYLNGKLHEYYTYGNTEIAARLLSEKEEILKLGNVQN